MIEWDVDALAEDDRALWDAMGAAVPAFSPMPAPGAPHELRAVEVICARLSAGMRCAWRRLRLTR